MSSAMIPSCTSADLNAAITAGSLTLTPEFIPGMTPCPPARIGQPPPQGAADPAHEAELRAVQLLASAKHRQVPPHRKSIQRGKRPATQSGRYALKLLSHYPARGWSHIPGRG
jgi:hypothetical protein